jgi:hypothetical protein
MPENLAPNPGFETPWAGSHDCVVFPVDAAPYRRQKQQIQQPVGWDVWYVHDHPTWTEPESSYMHRHLTPDRIESGENGYRIFGPSGPIWAGLRTQVSVEIGKRYALEAYAHAWTNHNDSDAIPGHEDCCGDPLCSWGAGRGGFAEKVEDLPELNGEPWNDALHGAAFRVGIDPTGGLDPLADTVVWSDAWAIYNEFASVGVAAEAENATVTLFLEQKLRWSFRNNDGYWDSISFVAVGEPVEEPVDYVPPAFDYVKSVVLFNPEASPAERAAGGIVMSHERLRGTDCQSVEDAASGPKVRNVKAVGWGEREDALRAYVDSFYPGANLEFVMGASPTEVGVKLLPSLHEDVALAQIDPRWADDYFGEDADETVGRYGCFVTGCAIILRDVYGVDVTLPILDQLLVNARVAYVSGNLLDWKGFTSLFSRLTNEIKSDVRLSAEELAGMLDDDWAIILRRSDGGHFVVLERVEENDLHIIDTWDGRRKVWSESQYLGIRAAKVKRPVLEPTPTPEPPTPQPPNGDLGSKVLFGAQQQRYGEGRDEFIARVKPPAWMLLQEYEEARRIKELSPETKVIIRYVDNDWGSYLFAADYDAAAERFINKFRGALEQNADYIDFVTGLNEYIAIDDYAALRASGVWMEAFCAALERIGYPGRPIGFNSGVGNPEHNYICDEKGIERQIPLMVRGARALMNAEGGFGHHAYHGSRADGFCTLTTNDERGNPNRLHYSMRSLLSIDPVLLEHGVVVDHYLTELGAIYYDPVHRMCNAGAGWRWPETMGEAAADRYVDELVMLNGFFREWNAAHNGRLKAALLFLFGGNHEWRYFDVEGAFSTKLADALVALRDG